MKGSTFQDNVASRHGNWVNLFEITNLADLALEYRLIDIQGLPQGENFDKNVNRLVKAVAYETKEPVALICQGENYRLAVPARGKLPNREQQLMPHVAILQPQEGAHTLEFTRLDAVTAPIAQSFLRYALNTPLMRNLDLWSVGRGCYSKKPLNASDTSSTVDIYPGFTWSLVGPDDGRLCLAVDTTVRYVDRLWFMSRLRGGDPTAYRMRHFLYHYGHQWYTIQLMGVTGQPISQQKFLPEGQTQPVDVFSWTGGKWRANPPRWIRNLDPKSPAILYRYPGSRLERYGALALCKLALSTADAEANRLHQQAIMGPPNRFRRIIGAVERYFQNGQISGRRIQVSTTPMEVPRRAFSVPPQRFGQDRVLGVGPSSDVRVTDIVTLDRLGRRRLELLLDSKAGPLDTTPFDAQYILQPLSLPRSVNDDFESRYVNAICEVSAQQGYSAQRILYDDRQANSLHQQVQAIKRAIGGIGIGRGYGLLVLPSRAKRDLHNYIKREFWPNLQFQCAMASKIRSFYEEAERNLKATPIPDKLGKLNNYVRNCALGMLLANRKWPWALAVPLHYDVYIGIDVLNGVAGFTFIYNRGETVIFQDHPCRQKERLTAAQLRKILTEQLRQDLSTLKLLPQSIVIHRDGRSFSSEVTGLRAAMNDLKHDRQLPADVRVGVVDIHKTTVEHLRLVEGDSLNRVENPIVGSYCVLNPVHGVVCNTGRPFWFSGTALPLAAKIVEGNLNIEWVLEDLFSLSQLTFTAPDKCSRLPLTIKIADDFLEPIAGEADEEEALYGEEPAETTEQLDEDALLATTVEA